MSTETIAMIVGLCASASGIIFAFLSFRKSERNDNRIAGKSEGTILSDIAHIKIECRQNGKEHQYRRSKIHKYDRATGSG